MRKNYKLNRDAAHRKALLKNLAQELITHGRVRTTLARAKALRPWVERAVTCAKKDSSGAKLARSGYSFSKEISTTLLNEIAPRFESRPGGYTRIIKLGPRKGDSAQMALIEWVE
ncbi:MAG: 50S ribosomal protein L17 [Patescibacteria group bacterium]